jgi:hypothetical protein
MEIHLEINLEIHQDHYRALPMELHLVMYLVIHQDHCRAIPMELVRQGHALAPRSRDFL